tara:strand:- start:394 stop:1326 length:933 start_codon:yes stop_codon:yes gene_type:complete
MNILVVGNGQHTNKRILPALLKIQSVENIEVVFNSKKNMLTKDNKIIYTNNKDVPNRKSYSLVIYATPPRVHLENLNNYFGLSNNHLIEKPLSSDFKFIEDEKFKNLYKSKNIFESLMYLHHPAIEVLKKIISENICLEFRTTFKVPHADFDHYRYKKEEGGGSLLDQGIYPISLVLFLFKDKLQILKKNIFHDENYDVDLSGQIIGKTNTINKITAEWALGDEYENYAEIACRDKVIKFPFIFSKNENDTYKYLEIQNEKIIEKELGLFDQFVNLYSDILNNKIQNFAYSNYEELVYRYKFINGLYKNQ